VRLFIAVNLPAELREAVFVDAASLRRPDDGMSWVPPERLHLTLKFLGECERTLLEPLGGVLRRVTADEGALALSLGGLGAFPNFSRARVVWIAVDDGGRLARLAAALDRQCEALGIERERRRFQPHLTIGRVRGELSPTTARALADQARSPARRHAAVVRSVDLMHSEPSHAGPRYHVVDSAPLGER
jgi:RNA 2',3'-cyclic 3'-phosphodiesterase